MNAILGMATFIELRDVLVFVKSARRFMPSEDVKLVLWIHESQMLSFEILREYGVELKAVTGIKTTRRTSILSKALQDLRSLLGFAMNRLFQGSEGSVVALKRWGNPAIVRFLYFEEFLVSANCVNRIFLSDVRDVVFQGSVFEKCNDMNNLYSAKEAGMIGEKGMVRENAKTRRWCRMFLGRMRAKSLSQQQVYCVGTILGARTPVMKFLKFYRRELASRWLVLWGLDTALYLDYLFNVITSSCFITTGSS